MFAAFSSAWAQNSVTVQGRVIERQGQNPVAGVSVNLTDRATVLTGADGRFVFRNVAPGRYVLTVQGQGYAQDEQTLVVRGDTTVLIALDVLPVRLDTLAVQARTITVTGTVRDGKTGIGLIDVDVFASPDRRLLTDPLGRFRLNKVPAVVPFTIQVQEFGYLPHHVTVVAERDTSLRIDLQVDSVVEKMITAQKRLIVERAGPRQYKWEGGVIDRPQLLRDLNGSVTDVLKRILGSANLEKVQCVIIDEKPAYSSRGTTTVVSIGRGRTPSRAQVVRGPPAALGALGTLMPDRVEYIDLLTYGRMNEGYMVRVFTRDYVARMTGGAERLVPLEQIIEKSHVGTCG
ncbi:MAG: carboxypeptidase regulatory-like domain-containing protein [Longimicrobiales bacterium]